MLDHSITSETKGKHLTYQDRLNIERWYNKDGMSNREIAALLNKAYQTINNELKRGQLKLKHKVKYSAQKAQENYQELRKHSVRHNKLTPEIDHYVSTRLKEDKDSLEVIHLELKSISLKSLYNWVNWGWLNAKRHHLFYPQYKTEKKIKPHAPKHPYGLSIEERPERIKERSEVGYYEIDTVILTRAKNKVLLTLTERKYRTEIIRLIDSKTAQAVNDALKALQESYDFKSITA
jgi:IS30 family transposase